MQTSRLTQGARSKIAPSFLRHVFYGGKKAKKNTENRRSVPLSLVLQHQRPSLIRNNRRGPSTLNHPIASAYQTCFLLLNTTSKWISDLNLKTGDPAFTCISISALHFLPSVIIKFLAICTLRSVRARAQFKIFMQKPLIAYIKKRFVIGYKRQRPCLALSCRYHNFTGRITSQQLQLRTPAL